MYIHATEPRSPLLSVLIQLKQLLDVERDGLDDVEHHAEVAQQREGRVNEGRRLVVLQAAYDGLRSQHVNKHRGYI